MIGKPEWFTYRTFGWGISPRTWQGWVYVCALAFLLGFITAIGFTSQTKMWLYITLIIIIMLDVLHIMTQLPKVHDERENLKQLVIERNCSFAAISGLVIMAIYETLSKGREIIIPGMTFDLSILVVLGFMLLTKIGSTVYLNSRM